MSDGRIYLLPTELTLKELRRHLLCNFYHNVVLPRMDATDVQTVADTESKFGQLLIAAQVLDSMAAWIEQPS